MGYSWPRLERISDGRFVESAEVLDTSRSLHPRCSPPLFKVLEHLQRFFDAIFRHQQLNAADYAWIW